MEDIMDIGSRLELFVDDCLIEAMEGVVLKLHHPIPREVALCLDRPWEGPISYDPVVIKEGDRYRMWYRGWYSEGGALRTCYAESSDGIVWERVTVGDIEFEGSKENNIVIDGSAARAVCVFGDENPDAPDAERYKATGVGVAIEGRATIMALISADGIHWKPMQEEPIIVAPAESPHFDSHNIFFWDGLKGHYVAYLRDWIEPGIRSIRRGTSPDFRAWSALKAIDMGDSPTEQLYKNAAQPYFRAPHIYLMFPKRFVPERKAIATAPHPGVSDTVFMSSRDGCRWDRRFMEAFLRPGMDPDNWTDRNMYVGPRVTPTGPDEMSIYYMEHYRHPTVRIRRASLRTDGFVSVHARYDGGELLTKPLTFEGEALVLNYATSAVGSVQVEIQDAEGRPIPGYSLSEACEIYGDEVERVVSWTEGADVGRLAGRAVRLRFAMKDADLFSMRFRI